MCPYSPTLVVSNAREDTYGESDDPVSPEWMPIKRRLQGLAMLSNPIAPSTNFINRFFKLRGLALETLEEVTFAQQITYGEPEAVTIFGDANADTEPLNIVHLLRMITEPQIERPGGAVYSEATASTDGAQADTEPFVFSPTENLPSSSKPKSPESIAMVIYSLNLLGYPKFARRIEFLKNYDDFEEGEEPLSLESAQSFWEFVSNTDFRNRFSKLGDPVLGLSADGTLGATWGIADNKHLLVKFHRSPMVSFAMIGPNPDSPEDGKFRLNGRNTRERVIKILYTQGVMDWEAH